MAHRFAVATTIATWILLLVGGTVNPTGSSLACPDWPLCYGQFFPEMKDGVQFEHTHRLVASAVGIMTFILTVLLWRNRRHDRTLATLGIVATVAVILQGILGGLTVMFRLPMIVSVSHLALSMIFFVLLIYISLRSASGPRHSSENAVHSRSTPLCRSWIVITACAVYLQILLGALVRHTQAARVCGTEIPFCQTTLWPSTGPTQLHMAHRLVGLIVFVIVIVTTLNFFKQLNRHPEGIQILKQPWIKTLVLLGPWLTLIQIALGIVTVTSAIAVLPVTAHLGVAALMLANYAWLYFGLRR